MLHAYVQTFDVTENLEIFWKLNMAFGAAPILATWHRCLSSPAVSETSGTMGSSAVLFLQCSMVRGRGRRANALADSASL
jgi:hypothetical protein